MEHCSSRKFLLLPQLQSQVTCHGLHIHSSVQRYSCSEQKTARKSKDRLKSLNTGRASCVVPTSHNGLTPTRRRLGPVVNSAC